MKNQSRQRIYGLIPNKMNEEDRLHICTILIKAGYVARMGKEKKDNKGSYIYFVEYWEEKEVVE